jgi:hypothetical protein
MHACAAVRRSLVVTDKRACSICHERSGSITALWPVWPVTDQMAGTLCVMSSQLARRGLFLWLPPRGHLLLGTQVSGNQCVFMGMYITWLNSRLYV